MQICFKKGRYLSVPLYTVISRMGCIAYTKPHWLIKPLTQYCVFVPLKAEVVSGAECDQAYHRDKWWDWFILLRMRSFYPQSFLWLLTRWPTEKSASSQEILKMKYLSRSSTVWQVYGYKHNTWGTWFERDLKLWSEKKINEILEWGKDKWGVGGRAFVLEWICFIYYEAQWMFNQNFREFNIYYSYSSTYNLISCMVSWRENNVL